MSKIINIDITEEYTRLTLSDNVSELDMLFGVTALFDRLSPESKKILMPKLQQLCDSGKNTDDDLDDLDDLFDENFWN